MRTSYLRLFLFLIFTSIGSLSTASSNIFGEGLKEDLEFESSSFALHHVMDAHEWHILDYNGHSFSIPLPIILWDSGLKIFLSSKFGHKHEKVVEKSGNYYKIHHNVIYKTNANGSLSFFNGHPNNIKPLDFSITKNVASMLFASVLIFFIFYATARSYNKKQKLPHGIGSFLEPLIIFIRDEVVIPNIGKKKSGLFMPYLLTVFFFIWINNLIGLLPIPPGGGANVTGNIAVTMVLSVFTLILTNVFANKHYWLHVFDPLGNSFPKAGKILLYLILVPVELISIITKPFALMIRLFANITAGHIVILSLTALVFVFKTSLVAIATVPFTLFMNCIELLVALLQAYIFTLLSSLFIGLAVKEHGEHTEAVH